MNSYITALILFCTEKNVKLIDNTSLINKHRHHTSLLKGKNADPYKFLTAYGGKNSYLTSTVNVTLI